LTDERETERPPACSFLRSIRADDGKRSVALLAIGGHKSFPDLKRYAK